MYPIATCIFQENVAPSWVLIGMDTQQARDTLRAITDAIVETVKEAGPQGAPSSAVFLALQETGCSAAQYETLISTLCELGLIKRSAHTLYVP